MGSRGPWRPLEEELGSRAAFEAHQKSEAERTARVLARRRAANRKVLRVLLAFAGIILLALFVLDRAMRGDLPLFPL